MEQEMKCIYCKTEDCDRPTNNDHCFDIVCRQRDMALKELQAAQRSLASISIGDDKYEDIIEMAMDAEDRAWDAIRAIERGEVK